MQGKTLYEVYKHPSKEKIKSWERIDHEIIERNGYDVVVRGGSYNFSVTYKYRDEYNHEHVVYHTRDNVLNKVNWSEGDIIAVYSDSAYSGYCILHIDENTAVSCYYYNGKISDVRCTKIHSTILGKFYIIRNKHRLYLDSFMRI